MSEKSLEELEFEETGVTRKERWKIMWASIIGYAMDGLDVLILSFAMAAIVSEFGLTLGEGGLIATYTLIGTVLGGYLFGIFADYFGRVHTFSFFLVKPLLMDAQCLHQPLGKKGCQNAEADITGYSQQEAVKNHCPYADGFPDVEIIDEVDVNHAEQIHHCQSAEIGKEDLAKGPGAAHFTELSCEPGAGNESHQVAEGGLENIGRAAALRKYGHSHQSQQHVKGYGKSPFPASQKEPRQGGEEKLQRKGTHRHRNANESANGNERRKQPEKNNFPGPSLSLLQCIFPNHILASFVN
jgi:hypothetical protein